MTSVRRTSPAIDPRALGAAVACLVALGCVLATGGLLLEDIGWGREPAAAAALVSATTVGWWLGGRAWSATRARDWIVSAIAMAVLTMFLGAFLLVAFELAGDLPSLEGSIFGLAAGTLILGLIGIVLFGWIVAPLLLIPSAIWAAVMWRLVGRR